MSSRPFRAAAPALPREVTEVTAEGERKWSRLTGFPTPTVDATLLLSVRVHQWAMAWPHHLPRRV